MAATSMVQEVGNLGDRVGNLGIGGERCKIVFLEGTSYSLVETLAVGCIVEPQYTASQTDRQTTLSCL